jgi:PAS domain S-box-containing protein
MNLEPNHQSSSRPLLHLIVTVVILLTLMHLAMFVVWRPAPIIQPLPWIIPMLDAVMIVIASSVGFLAMVRYRVLRDPISYWTGMGFVGFSVGCVFYLLAWPGLLPNGGSVIGHFPSTAAWVSLPVMSILAICLLAADLSNWPGDTALSGRSWLRLLCGWIILVILGGVLTMIIEESLPVLVEATGAFTHLALAWGCGNIFLFALGTVLSARFYLRTGDTLSGCVSFTQMVFAFTMLMAVYGRNRYGLIFFLDRFTVVIGFLIMQFGLLSDYVRLFKCELEKSRILEVAATELRESQNRLMLATRTANVGIWDLNVRNNTLTWDDTMFRLYGITPDQFSGGYEAWQKGVHLEDLPRADEEVQMALRGEKEFDTEFRVVWPDESIHYIKAKALVQRDASGQAVHLLGTNWDITEIKHAEESLVKLSHAIEQSPVSIVITNIKGEIEYVNPKFTQMTGYSFEEVFGKNPRILKSGELPPEEYKELWEIITSGNTWQGEFHNKRKNGELFWEAATISPIMSNQGKISSFIAIKEDITDRKQAERVLRGSEARFRTLIENAPLAVGIGRDGVSLYANNNYLKMFGFERLDEIVGQPITDHWSPEWRELIVERGRQRSMGLPVPTEYEAVAQSADGSRFPAQIAVTEMDLPDGLATVAFITDLTERKKLEEQLFQSQKMESIGRLAGGIAHDFNNLLTPIFGYSEMLRMNTADDSPDRIKFDSIIMAADRARVLTQQLLSFSRKQVLEMRTVDLNDVVNTFYEILRRTVRENIAIRLNLTNDKLGIRADKNQLEQIIMNLVVNSQYAIKDKGIITVETVPVTLDDEFVCQHAVVAAGKYVMLAVTDTGCGMDEETLSHVFEPFFTTKGSEGSGLGLATVYGLIKQHNGFIWVYSEAGKGTAFKLYFPIIDESPQINVEAVQERPALNGDGRTILLVEDNAMVRKLVFDLLVSHGFTVIVGENSGEALKGSEGKHIDLMVSDVVMPDLNGPDLYQRLLKTHPDLKVLYMSGYTNNIIVHHGVLDEGINFIQKPFSVNDMAKKSKRF